jgi:hypothetical protein
MNRSLYMLKFYNTQNHHKYSCGAFLLEGTHSIRFTLHSQLNKVVWADILTYEPNGGTITCTADAYLRSRLTNCSQNLATSSISVQTTIATCHSRTGWSRIIEYFYLGLAKAFAWIFVINIRYHPKRRAKPIIEKFGYKARNIGYKTENQWMHHLRQIFGFRWILTSMIESLKWPSLWVEYVGNEGYIIYPLSHKSNLLLWFDSIAFLLKLILFDQTSLQNGLLNFAESRY